jgi:D-alanyl-D-alanine carboxypeptidase/D-alanyl-D-alanine-endopeptidase (penicillin-binding protein 4)
MNPLRPRLLVICWLTACAALAAAAPAARADLKAAIDPILADKLLQKGSVGVEIIRLGEKSGDDEIVFRHNAADPFVPASNLKLVTTAAALDKLGAKFRFQTVLALLPDGSVVIIGDGDPSLGDAEYLKKAGWRSDTLFERWAFTLKDTHKVRLVKDVIVDDGVFDSEFLHPRWPADQVHKRYVPEVGGLNLNVNCVDFLVQAGAAGRVVGYTMDPPNGYVSVRNTCVSGNENKIWLSRKAGTNDVILRGESRGSTQVPVSVTIHDPPMFAATVFAEMLSLKGVQRSGTVRREHGYRQKRLRDGDETAGWQVIDVYETPLTTILARTNKDSMNLYAESLCKRLGYESGKEAGAVREGGSWASGTVAMADFLRRIGVDEKEFALDDGCGLSKHNVISPNALAKVLAHEYHGAARDAYMNSLSVAGVDGTLEDRFRSNDLRDLRGRVVGKSGYINGVRTLSGYVKAKDGHHYAFSILMNRIPEDPNVKVLQEKIVRAVDNHAASVAAGQ